MKRNLVKAMSLFERAISLNYTSASVNLGISLKYGDHGFPQDLPHAFQLLSATARRNNNESVVIVLATPDVRRD